MTNTVRILGSRAREQVPGTSITLLAPGFRGSLTQAAANEESPPFAAPDLPFAEVATAADVMLAAQLTMTVEPRPPDGGPELRSRSAVAAFPRLIVPRRKGVAYALLQTDDSGASRFVMPLPRDDDEAVFPLAVSRDGVTRRTLRVFMWGAQASTSPRPVMERWERLRRPHQLLQLSPRGAWQSPDDRCERGPCLLLLHDTFGTPESSFADWLAHDSSSAVLARYGGGCIAFAHPTLATGVVENAAWLAQNLPANIRALDVIAHGRGGLIARVLAAEGRVRIRRGVLVGTPNYGTPLASAAHFADFLDGHVARLATIPRANARATLEGLLAAARFAAAVPPFAGIETQAPGSDVLLASDESLEIRPRWFSIGANTATSGEPAGDSPFKGVPNDLVVPSDGCHPPAATPDNSLRLSGEIHHHAYFSSTAVRERLQVWLS
jgi:pimeloyl-ACP methyl ester carboxylesterase